MLTLDFATIAFEFLNFIVLALLLYRFLFKPVMRRVNERAAEKERLLSDLALEKEAIQLQRAELEEKLAQIEDETAVTLTHAHSQAQAIKKEGLKQARIERVQILDNAQQEATQWQKDAVTTFNQTLLDTVLEISGQIIGRVTPQSAHDELVTQLNQQIWELGRQDMQRVETIRHSLGERSPTAEVVTARPLSTDQQGQLIRTLSALADSQVSLEVEEDDKLAAGLRVRLGDLVVNHSIAQQLADLRETVDDALQTQLLAGSNGRV